jgi:hypothetical protein
MVHFGMGGICKVISFLTIFLQFYKVNKNGMGVTAILLLLLL